MNLLRSVLPSSNPSSSSSSNVSARDHSHQNRSQPSPPTRAYTLQSSGFSPFSSSSFLPTSRSTPYSTATTVCFTPQSTFPLFSRLPTELVEDILSLYLDSSFLLTTATSLSSQFNGLITSDSFCQRLLFLLYSSLPSPATPLSSFTDLTLWEDVPTYYSLLRSLHSVSHLLGHWRSAACYLGQLLCFSLDVRAKQLVGMEVGIGSEAGNNRAVVEIDLLEEEEPRVYYLEYRPVSPVSSTTCIRHPALLSFQRTEEAAEVATKRPQASYGHSLRSSITSFFSYSTAVSTPSAEPADAFTPPSVAMSSTYPHSSFNLFCPSLPSSAYLALGMQNLPTPIQRRQQNLFYPNPPSTYYRLPPPSSLQVHPPAPYPPSGLYVGQYGPHGPELMHVDYVGSELIATKVIGDANVPAGKVSFRVQLPFSVAVSKPQERVRAKGKRGDGKRRRSRGQGRMDERKEDTAVGLSSTSSHMQADNPALSPASKRAHLNALSMSTSSDGLSAASTGVSPVPGSRESSMMRSEEPIVGTSSLDPHSPVSDHHTVDVSVSDDDTSSNSRNNEDDETAHSDSENSDTHSLASSSASLSSPPTPPSPHHSDADADADMDTTPTNNLVSQFLHYRRHLPPTLPTSPTLLTHTGSGTIALTGFNNPQAVAVQCYFHQAACFSLDFLGLIGFVPFVCDCHDPSSGGAEGVEEREERRARVRRARRNRERELAAGGSGKGSQCTRQLMRL